MAALCGFYGISLRDVRAMKLREFNAFVTHMNECEKRAAKSRGRRA